MHERMAARGALIALALLGAGAARSAPAGVVPAAGPLPATNPGSWIQPADYPPAALRAGAEGRTAFTVKVAPDGSVESCSVTKTSGSAALDQRTCELISQRARFTPATGKNKRPVAGIWSEVVKWQIPKPPPPKPGMTVVSAQIGVDGTPTDCRLERVESAAASDVRRVGPIAMCPIPAFSSPFLDAAGNPVVKRVRVTNQLEVLDPQ